MSLRVRALVEVKPGGGAVAKPTPIRQLQSRVVDPKRGELSMGRVKRR
jgi:hypothetical protein